MTHLFTQLAASLKHLTVALLVAGTARLPAASQTIYGLEYSTNVMPAKLLSFSAATPGNVLTRLPIVGITSGQIPIGIDFRPSTGELFALGYDATTQTGQLYTLNLATAVATPVGSAALALPLGIVNYTIPQADPLPHIGFDFDPVADRVRVCSGNTQANLLLNPITGAIIATNTSLFYVPGDAAAGTTPGIGTLAYTNAYAGSTATALYAVDEAADRLVATDAPASGGLRTVAPFSVSTATFLNRSRNLDLDFYYDPATGSNTGYFSASSIDPASGYALLTTLNPTTGSIGTFSWIGPLGGYYEVRDIAVQPAARVLAALPPAELTNNLVLTPNPISSSTSLAFDLPRAAHVELTVTDALGRVVDVLDAGPRLAGPQAVAWQRRQLGAGIYFFTLRLDGQPAGTRRGVLAD